MSEEKKELRYITLHFRNSHKPYVFSVDGFAVYPKDLVVVETKRGLELGEVISEMKDTCETMPYAEIKPVLRLATSEDRQAHGENLLAAKKMRKQAQAKADELALNMNFIDAEFTLDRSNITLTYLADARVDFRELLKQLAPMFHCRIDLRQVGARDKAKTIGGIGVCGRELCCSKFISDFERISINMAKNQLLALNIAKLSGHCGSLMCCLRFEDDAYKELRRGLPKPNSRVEYEGEMYRIGSMNVLQGTCKLENHNHVFFLPIEDVMKYGKFKRHETETTEDQKKVSE